MNLNNPTFSLNNEAYIVFQDENSLWWLQFLHKNFRHCYVLIKDVSANSYLELNPYSNQFILTKHQFCDGFNYISFLQGEGKTICKVSLQKAPIECAPWFFFTCVEFVKRFIGLHQRNLITPYQLYNFLQKQKL